MSQGLSTGDRAGAGTGAVGGFRALALDRQALGERKPERTGA
jgi:hypothetical protein